MAQENAIRESPGEQKLIYEGYLVSIILKGLISLNETVTGIALLFIPPSIFLAFTDWVADIVPTSGFIGAHLAEQLNGYTASTSHFLALYLFSRGIVKLVLIIALLRNKLWAYPSLLLVMAGFLLYQFYQIAASGSILVIGITVLDIIVMYFVWREWRIVRERAARAA
ncbi:MAG TPA: DUF2127 domain-containing protein [Candidatus Paceibacterota bacterium]|jgi:uncharacterized membrane protein|nr:DUF2127 domain-containing protein [Candidatus Paceibacterota bacterium]